MSLSFDYALKKEKMGTKMIPSKQRIFVRQKKAKEKN